MLETAEWANRPRPFLCPHSPLGSHSPYVPRSLLDHRSPICECFPICLRSPLAARTPGGIDGNQVGAVSPATSLTIVSEMTGTCAANMMLGRGYPLAFFCGVPIFIYDRN